MLNVFKFLLYAASIIFLCANIFTTVVHGDKVTVVELTANWTLQNQNGSITQSGIKIPTSVYSALSATYGDVLQSKNDVNLRWIAYDNWTFSNTFYVNTSDYTNVNAINLTIYGIDTISTVRLNGIEIGRTDNMFVRYYFNVLRFLKPENVLEIEIMSPIWAAKELADEAAKWNTKTPPDCPPTVYRGECHRNMLRKMQMSFGSEVGPAVPSMGIWKTIALEYYEVAILRDVDVAVEPNSTHWIMDVRVYFSTDLTRDFYGNISLFAPDLLEENPFEVGLKIISYKSPVISFKVPVPKESVKLWWPNRYGDPNLYPIYVAAKCWADTEAPKLSARTLSHKLVKIGFRTVHLVEDLEDDGGRTFYFKVNDVPIFLKGAVYLPSHILPENYDERENVEHILRSAQDANMNVIRVWGGGLYESKTFYDAADNFGLLVWQDMAFTSAAYPVDGVLVESIRMEISQNAKFLASHPSLIFVVTNDEIELYLTKNIFNFTAIEFTRLENEYEQLFKGTIKPELNVISRNSFDPRPGPMISTPSKGIEENKNDLSLDAQDVNYGDVHFWREDLDGWDPDIYPRARFVSEYGFQSLPAKTSWNLTMAESDNITDLIKHRQHNIEGMSPMLQLIERHLPFSSSDWEHDIDALIYFSQITQAMAVKTATDLFRSQRVNYRTMGAIYWHLNDVWVAPSWSSIDYYGNYKILYYWSVSFYSPLSIVALYDPNNSQVNITLIRDELSEYPDARKYTETINVYYWNKMISKKSFSRNEVLETNSVEQRSVPLQDLISEPFTVTNCFLEFELIDSKSNLLSSTFLLPTNLKNIEGITDPEIKAEIAWRYCNEDNISTTRRIAYSLEVRISYPALFVFIQIVHPKIKKYKLSDNGFIQTVPIKMVYLEYDYESECLAIENENIQVQTMNQYILAEAEKKQNTSTTKNSRRRRRRKVEL